MIIIIGYNIQIVSEIVYNTKDMNLDQIKTFLIERFR